MCIHGPSREWIIKALLSILEKVSGAPVNSVNSTKSPSSHLASTQPAWLTMSMDGAFGSKTHVFTINRPLHKKTSTTPQSKLSITNNNNNNEQNNSISINLQACPAIFKQILEILSTLARAASFNFFPRYPPANRQAIPLNQSAAKSAPQFWELVVKLDQFKNKSSKLSQISSTTPGQKSVATTSANTELYEIDSDMDFSVENSPLARLMSMLDYPVLKNNPNLMDKMFTCLAHASAGIPLVDPNLASSSTSTSSTTSTVLENNNNNSELSATSSKKQPIEPINVEQQEPVLGKQIELVVNVLKNKLCSQDGLQQAYTLLNNLSRINPHTRNMILKHLLSGTRELGIAVCNEIELLMDEAFKYNAATAAAITNNETMDVAPALPTTSQSAR